MADQTGYIENQYYKAKCELGLIPRKLSWLTSLLLAAQR